MNRALRVFCFGQNELLYGVRMALDVASMGDKRGEHRVTDYLEDLGVG